MSQIFQKIPPNYLYTVGLSNLVDYEFSTVSIAGPITNGNLHNLIIPANTFVQDGQKLSVFGVGSSNLAGAAGDLTVTINGSQVGGSDLPTGAISGWRYVIELQRNSGNLLLVSQFIVIGIQITNAVSSVTPASRSIYFIVNPFVFTQDAIIQFRGSAPGTGSIFNDAVWSAIH